MKKQLVIALTLLLAVCIAAPASADVQFKYGGIMRVRFLQSYNMVNSDYLTDNANFDPKASSLAIDQRTRLYFQFIASENLKLVTKFEFGNFVWGRNKSSGRLGADRPDFKLKNSYLDFNIPCTPTKALIGVQGISLLDDWMFGDDAAAAMFVTKLDPFTITLGYISGSNEVGWSDDNGTYAIYNEWRNRVDDWVASVDYKSGPFSASLINVNQIAHNTPLAAVPWTLQDPLDYVVPYVNESTGPIDFFSKQGDLDDPYYRITRIRSNNLINLGGNFTYKTDWISAYVQGVKNLGTFKYDHDDWNGNRTTTSASYTGWMLDAGVNLFYGPYTFNLTGFYTSGPKHKEGTYASVDDIDWFTYTGVTSKYFSEIVGGGVLDQNASADVSDAQHLWRGYPYPTNLWTVSAGAAWQVLDQTKLSASYWYFGTSSKVLSYVNADGTEKSSSNIGHELNLYVTQGIVDGLTLDLVAAYLFTGDAYKVLAPGLKKEDVYELGARLQWAF